MKSERNIEGYLDPTASVAIGQASRAENETDKRARDLIKVLKAIVRLVILYIDKCAYNAYNIIAGRV